MDIRGLVNRFCLVTLKPETKSGVCAVSVKTLPPLIFKPAYYAAIEKEINAFFRETLYRPLLLCIQDQGLENVRDALADAIASGRVEYSDGVFRGRFNAAISKRLRDIGAKYRPISKVWTMDKVIPPEIAIAIAQAEARYQALMRSLIRTLDDIDIDKAIEGARFEKSYEKTVGAMDSAFVQSVRAVTIAPKMTPDMKTVIARDWTNNLKLYIRDWTASNILKLRQKIQANSFSGQRFENLIKTIQDNYGVSKTKAKFLARQETSLLMSKMREERYKDVGLLTYRWSGSLDERERPDHRLLEGKIFSWDSPPIVDRKTGRTGHPGEDFLCRCLAIPILPGEA